MSETELFARAQSLHKSGRAAEAKALYMEILRANPGHADALHFLGLALHQEGDNQAALELMQKALELSPANTSYYSNIAIVLTAMGHYDEALSCYKTILKAAPASSGAHCNMGNIYDALDDLEKASRCYRRALELEPRSAEYMSSLGNTWLKLNQPQKAIETLREAVRVNPSYLPSHINLSLALFMAGEYEEGWREFEWRLKKEEFQYCSAGRPRPEDVPGGARSILVLPEQGLGDTIQFARFLPILKERCPKVIFLCQQPLRRVFENFHGAHVVVDKDSRPPESEYDAQIPLMSLPFFLKTGSNIPSGVPYLRPDDALAAQWDKKLGPHDARRVGLIWSGNPTYGRHRRMTLADLKPLLGIPGVKFYSLQKGPPAAELADMPGSGIIDHTAELGDFSDTAALMANLDLVISVDTGPAHLAGALGLPVWFMLPFSADWRWMLGRTDSPWYPSARLFRQPSPRDWKSVVASISSALSGDTQSP